MNRWTMHPLIQLTLARLRDFLRQPEAVFWVYVFPLIMVLALGMAFRSQPVESATIAVQDGGDAESVRATLAELERFDVVGGTAEQCRSQLRTGKADLVVVVDGQQCRYVYDPTRPGSLLAREAVDDALQRAAGRTDVLESSREEVSEPGGRYIDFLVPGLVGMGLMGGGLWGVGFAIVDMRIRKLLKRLMGTPMRKFDFLAAIMLSRLAFMLPEIVLLLTFSSLVFEVVNYGSYLLVGLLILLGAFEFSGIGLLVASRARTIESVSGLMNLVMVPMWIGSGIFFSSDRFPEIAQPLIRLLPLTPLIRSLRAVMLEGASLAQIGPDVGIMLGWAGLTFGVALLLFRWE
jgi:ABC-type multidrug transport system permease subunit